MDIGVSERRSRLRGAVVWSRPRSPVGHSTRVLPDGCMDLIWDGDGTLLVAGPDTRAHLVTKAAVARYTGLRFAPGTAPALLGVRADELRDQRVPLDDLWPLARVRRLAERIAAAPDAGAALEAVAAGLREASPPDPVCEPVVAALRHGGSVADTAYEVGLSERQLHRRCLALFGYGPKTLARVLRMQRALQLARGGAPLALVAARAGYADQAHLSREVRALAGVPPLSLLGA